MLARLLLMFGLLLVPVSTAAAAGWLDAVRQRLAGQQPSPVVTLDAVAAHIKSLPAGNELVLAGEAGADGHWRLVNRAGETFSAATPDELTRAFATLLPSVPQAKAGRIVVYVTDESVFRYPAALAQMPAGTWLMLRTADGDYRIIQNAQGPARWLLAELRPATAKPPGGGLFLEISDRASFDAARRHLARRLDAHRVRVLALEPGAKAPAKTPNAAPKDASHPSLVIHAIDPDDLRHGMWTFKGQTVVMFGRRDGERLVYQPASGSERSLLVRDYAAAAAANDVDLLILHAANARQPGTRNWLWLKTGVQGLEPSLAAPTLGDALVELVGDSGGIQVALKPVGGNQDHLVIMPAYSVRGRPSTSIIDVVGELVGGVTGVAQASRLEGHLVSDGRRTELAARIIPGIPATPQLGFLAALLVGLPGFAQLRRWWALVWPPEARTEYGAVAGYVAAKAVRETLFTLLFMPLLGIWATLWQLARLIVPRRQAGPDMASVAGRAAP
ncbi:MAG: hypothetical protein ACKVP7_29265 [Hyphomicrobiaceae bacterium]